MLPIPNSTTTPSSQPTATAGWPDFLFRRTTPWLNAASD
jgi:hypothetical protein